MMRRFVIVLIGVLALATAALANMPGTFQPMLMAGADCTGGTISKIGSKTIHVFTSSGTLVCTQPEIASDSSSVVPVARR
jgi:hypothetical protein